MYQIGVSPQFGFISILGNRFFQCYQVTPKKKFEIVS